MIQIIVTFLLCAGSLFAYTDITATQVHNRLVAGDTLLLLDVRERATEYNINHIAEPAGQLPVTPVNMPYNSGVFAAQYTRLPLDKDIIVYCASGGRSAGASTFLSGHGYSRVFNMTGGFGGWTFERRSGGYGDHTGGWIYPSTGLTYHIYSIVSDDTNEIAFPSASNPFAESIYIEMHTANTASYIPGYVHSNIAGLYRIDALDQYGVPLYISDSLLLRGNIDIKFTPQVLVLKSAHPAVSEALSALIPATGWRNIAFSYFDGVFSRTENFLRKWYNCESYPLSCKDNAPVSTFKIAAYPNPFNSTVRFNTPAASFVQIYDISGELVDEFGGDCGVWKPNGELCGGIYYAKVSTGTETATLKLLYLK
jgi:rhodanese-related sulfurtransferase